MLLIIWLTLTVFSEQFGMSGKLNGPAEKSMSLVAHSEKAEGFSRILLPSKLHVNQGLVQEQGLHQVVLVLILVKEL